MHHDNEITWDVWQICNEFGRDSKDRLKINAVLKTTKHAGGDNDDVTKILLLENIYQRNLSQKKND